MAFVLFQSSGEVNAMGAAAGELDFPELSPPRLGGGGESDGKILLHKVSRFFIHDKLYKMYLFIY